MKQKMIYKLINNVNLPLKLNLNLLLLTLAFLIGGNSEVYSQKKFNVDFGDDYKEVVEFVDNNPDHIQKRFLTIGLLGLRLISFDEVSSVSGPFVADIKWQKFIDKTDKIVQVAFYFSPIEAQKLEYDHKYEVYPMSIDMNFGKSFLTKQKVKKLKLNFHNEARQEQGYDYTIHRAKLPVNFQTKFYGRVGAIYNQYSDGRYFGIDSTKINIHSVKSVALYVGISKLRMGFLHYKSDGFGEQKGSWMSDVYFDLMYAPVLSGFGTHEYYSKVTNNDTVLDEGLLPNTGSKMELHRFGMRFGSTRKSALTKAKVGAEMSYEIAYFPGLGDSYFYFGLGYKLLLSK